MNLTLHQMRVFTTVAELGSVSLAAEKLHMTQPGVSNILKQLQEHYNCALTEVVSRKIFLTAFGEILYSGFVDIQASVQAISNKINELQGRIAGTLRVSTVSTAKYFMPGRLGLFRESFPDVQIKLSVLNREGIIGRLKQNLDDFAVMSHPPEKIVTHNIPLYDDELIVIASPKLMLGKSPAKTLHELQSLPWLQRESGSGTRYATEQIFRQQRFKANTIIEIGDNEAIKHSVMANLGIAVISRASCQLELTDRLLQVVPVEGFPVLHKWYVVRNKGKVISPLVDRFIEFMIKQQL